MSESGEWKRKKEKVPQIMAEFPTREAIEQMERILRRQIDASNVIGMPEENHAVDVSGILRDAKKALAPPLPPTPKLRDKPKTAVTKSNPLVSWWQKKGGPGIDKARKKLLGRHSEEGDD